MIQIKLSDKIARLTNEEILQLAEELRCPVVPDEALVRQVIKDTEHDTTAPMLAFIAVQGILAFEIADRFKYALGVIKILQGRK